MASILCILVLLLLVSAGDSLINARLFLAVFALPILCVLAVMIYLWGGDNAYADTVQSHLSLFALRLICWLGTFWQLLCGTYLMIEWASSRGLLIWFPN